MGVSRRVERRPRQLCRCNIKAHVSCEAVPIPRRPWPQDRSDHRCLAVPGSEVKRGRPVERAQSQVNFVEMIAYESPIPETGESTGKAVSVRVTAERTSINAHTRMPAFQTVLRSAAQTMRNTRRVLMRESALQRDERRYARMRAAPSQWRRPDSPRSASGRTHTKHVATSGAIIKASHTLAPHLLHCRRVTPGRKLGLGGAKKTHAFQARPSKCAGGTSLSQGARTRRA